MSIQGGVARPAVGVPVVAPVRAGTRARRGRMRPGDLTWLWISRAVIWGVVVATLFPAAWVVTSSFQRGDAFISESLIPRAFTTKNYEEVVAKTRFTTWVRNSLIVCAATALLTTTLVLFMAFPFSRLRFFGRRWGLFALFLLQTFPASMALVAYYTILAKLRLLDTLTGLVLILAGGGIPYFAWLTKGYLDSIPRELDEAAYVDGATTFQVLRHVLLPLALPMAAVVFLFAFLGVYNEYVLSSAVLRSPTSQTVAVGMRFFIADHYAQRWTLFAAASIMASVPVMALFYVLQRYLVSGLTRGAVKS